jgi:membrane-associated phospholipid phosphatase
MVITELHASTGRDADPCWFRSSEWVMIAYFLYAAVISAVLPVPTAVTSFTIGLNLTLVGGFVTLAYASRLRPEAAMLSIVRDWFPLSVLVLAYREMGWFAPAHHSFELEQGWVVWDRLLLNGWGAQGAIESLGPLLPGLLELCYSLVYTIGPFSMAALYFWGRRERADAFLFRFLLGTVFSYALFPYFPSEPPRAVFPGENFPTYDTIFRQFNWWLLGNQGIHTSVFPSAHVSSAYAGAFAMFRVMPERRWAGWALTVLATGIFCATIYGRYHYAVDAVAGLGVAVAMFFLCERIESPRALREVGRP